MNATDVAIYLREHPEFFEEHLDLLASVKVRHPHGNHAIPLVERQMLAMREKSRKLEGSLRELLSFGEQNDVTWERMHRMTLALLRAPDMLTLLHAVDRHLRDDFGLDASAVRLWGGVQGSIAAEFDPASAQIQAFGEGLTAPHLGTEPMLDTATWFSGNAAELASFAYVPLRAEKTFGLLVFASRDAKRFTPEMGTLYVERLGEMVSMALRRFLEM